MRYRGSNGRLEGFKNHTTRLVLLLLVIALLSFVPRAVRTPQQTKKRPISAPEILAEASRLALLHNWQAAAPLFREAEISFAAQSDQRNFLYAHIGRLRGEIESQSLPEVSEYLV